MKGILALWLTVLLAACAHQAKKVDCTAHLEAINSPNPVVKPETTPRSTP